MCFLLLDGKPPQKVSTKNQQKMAQYGALLQMQGNPHAMKVPLKSAACQEPLCCCLSLCGAPCGFTACWSRSKVLDTYWGGIPDYKCCQG